jgi:beta-galactosidase
LNGSASTNVNGYCIHALAAGDWILGAGLIDLWRQPKSYAYEGTKAANQPRVLAIRSFPRNVYATKGSGIEITGINELDSVHATLTVVVMSEDGKAVLREKTETQWSEGVSKLFEEKFQTQRLRGRYTIQASVCAKNGSVLAQNTCDIDVFSEQDLATPTAQIAVLDSNGSLTRYLKKAGIRATEFDASISKSIPVFVTSILPKAPAQRKRVADLIQFIEVGGTAVFMQNIGMSLQRSDSNPGEAATLPFTAQVEPARGLWTCIPHLVHDHPIFAGLPSNGMMRDVYENVWATQTLRELGGETIVASVGFEWFSHDHEMHYSGPGESWWGADLAIVPHGKGQSVVSQLRIVENLGKDPVADKILFNLIQFATGGP